MAVLDHLILGAPELSHGMDAVERALGVRPAIGGKHLAFGTHNALVSLGPETYLEVIAPDPEVPAPGRPRLFGLNELTEPKLVRWVARTADLEGAVGAARGAGFDLGVVSSGSRTKPDGSLVTWRLTDPYVDPADGLVPFLLDWGGTPSPARSAPLCGTLAGFRLRHPDPERVRSMLAVLRLDVPVEGADAPGLEAVIRTEIGNEIVLG